jgi:hypothetical protein
VPPQNADERISDLVEISAPNHAAWVPGGISERGLCRKDDPLNTDYAQARTRTPVIRTLTPGCYSLMSKYCRQLSSCRRDVG